MYRFLIKAINAWNRFCDVNQGIFIQIALDHSAKFWSSWSLGIIFLSFFIGHLREMEQLSNLNLNQTPAEEILCHPTLIKPLPILWKRDQGLVANISLLHQCCKMKNLPWMQKCFVWCMKWDKKDNCKTCFGVFNELLSTQFVNVACLACNVE